MDLSNKCSICNSLDLNKVFEIKSYPAYIVPVPKNISKDVIKADLALFVCSNCGHLQALNPDPELQRRIYEEYYSYYVVDSSESFSPHYRKPFTQFIDRLEQNGLFTGKENFLEIGCSSGQQVPFFKKIAKNYYGIDPSEKIKLAIEKFPDDKFIHGYFPEDIPSLKFDILVSQFNLEHILNVQEFMQKAYASLTEKGIIILQVPDIGDFARNKQPNFLAHEHIQYFTKNSLRKLIESQGFEIIEWGASGPSLIVAAKKDTKKEHFNFQEGTAQELKNADIHLSLFNNKPGKITGNIAYYGVGPQLYWLLSFKEDDSKHFAICDDNPNYEGQGLPGYGNEIQKPSEFFFAKYNTVVLSLNKFYHEAVINKLKKYKIPMNVYLINKEGNWENIKI
jgi:SAM-dependent methyltransferase